MPDDRRVLTVLLKDYGPLCERCLARHGRMTLSRVAAMLERFSRVIAVRVKHGQCPKCRKFTRIFSFAETHSGPAGGAIA